MYQMIIADDDAIIRGSLLSRYDWESMGFHIAAVCEDGREVIEQLQSGLIDVVLCDIVMCDVSGLEVARYIQENRLHTRVVLISGYQEFEYARRGISYGVSAYLLKPLEVDELQSAFANVAAELKRIEELRAQDKYAMPYLQDPDVLRIKTYLQEHLSENPSTAELAEVVHLSARHLSRKFLTAEGQTISKYILDLQMSRAMTLLRSGSMSIPDICQRTGFSDEKYFRRVFRSYFGYSVSKLSSNGFIEGDKED